MQHTGSVIFLLLYRSRQRRKLLSAPLKPLHSGSMSAIAELSSAEIDPSEIAICKHPDGSDWLLGQGSFGQVGLCRTALQFGQVLRNA